jgi:hypothetical protein
MSGYPRAARGSGKCGLRFVSVCAAAILAACSSAPVADRTGPSTSQRAGAQNSLAPAPQVAPAEPPTPSEPQAPAVVQLPPPPQIPPPANDQRPQDSGIAIATCVPAQPPKWQLRHKRKATPSKESKQAPPPTASSVTETPPATPVEPRVGEFGSDVTSILGKKVQGPKGEDLGRVVDVLADGTGHVRAAIIDFGGFLGVGTRRIAVDWPLLRFDPNARDKNLILILSREKLQSAPEYKDAKRPQVLMPPAPAPDTAAEAADTKK